MCNMLGLESQTVTGRLQSRCAVGEKTIINEIPFAEFRKEYLAQRLYSHGTVPHIEQGVGVGINRGVPPISLVTELDHGFINHNVIQIDTAWGM